MAQAANLVLADGQSTPVNVTFAVEQATPALSTFADRASGVPAFFRRITQRISWAGGVKKVNTTALTVTVPVFGLVNGVNTSLYTLRGKVELTIPQESTDQNRKDLYAFVKNAMSNAILQGAMRDLDPIY